jgi:hypothetical protein
MLGQASRILIHIGPHKTGSTYLQKTLHDHRDLLKAHGIAYPDVGIGPQWGHHKIIKWIRGSIGSDISGRLGGILDDARVAILSSENFDRLDAVGVEKLAKLLPPAEVKFVYFIREPSELIYSSWQESVKHGGVNSFFEYALPQFARPFRSRLFNHSLVLDNYAKRFGQDAIVLIDYNWAKANGDIYDIFCEAVELPGIKGLGGGKVINKSFEAWEAEVIRALNLLAKEREQLQGVNVLSAYMQLKRRGAIDQPLNDLRDCIDRHSVPTNLSKAYFEDSVVFNSIMRSVTSKYRLATPLSEESSNTVVALPGSGWLLCPSATSLIESIFRQLPLNR